MIIPLTVVAAVLLSVERLCYVWAWRSPGSFRAYVLRRARGTPSDPVVVLERLFYGFKALQMGVFVGWCWILGDRAPWPEQVGAANVLGTLLIVVGLLLNAAVFARLGRVGVFYGRRFGHDVAWCDRFPFSVFTHPQYVGTVVSIWGFFLALRHPHVDWLVLPALETVYYVLGARYESEGMRPERRILARGSSRACREGRW